MEASWYDEIDQILAMPDEVIAQAITDTICAGASSGAHPDEWRRHALRDLASSTVPCRIIVDSDEPSALDSILKKSSAAHQKQWAQAASYHPEIEDSPPEVFRCWLLALTGRHVREQPLRAPLLREQAARLAGIPPGGSYAVHAHPGGGLVFTSEASGERHVTLEGVAQGGAWLAWPEEGAGWIDEDDTHLDAPRAE